MDNKGIKQINDIFRKLDNRELGPALRSVRSLIDTYPHMMYDEELENIEGDYNLMLDYMRRGFNDPHRADIYNNLTDRLYSFACDMFITYRTQHVEFFIEALRKSMNNKFSNETVKAELEGFVADTAMLSLEAEATRTEKGKELYRKHNDFMQSLFCNIIVSHQWSVHDSEFFKTLLMSPTVDTIDAQLLVSALTLATMNNMDVNKFEILVHLYLNSTDEKVRQRALVGWVFALSSRTRLLPKMKNIVAKALEDESMVNELADLQKQIIYCMNAEQDTDTIRRDIMPELMKNNNLKITRFGITEKDEDPMADVFDPGASERAMEKMEESFQKMMNMQKAGSDIYFGGFSQMKRFPFFYNVANWFCPFYIEHPEISQTAGNLKDTLLLINILKNGPFCDSDKYSFTLAVASVISRLPDNMKEMLNTPEALGPAVSHEDQQKPAYIRRMILQDMYRFFRLFPQRGQLVNPFDGENFTFITDNLFDGTGLHELVPDLCYFMIKHRNEKALKNIMAKFADGDNSKMRLINGLYELNFAKRPQKAVQIFKELNAEKPDNKRVLSLLARSYFESEQYENAAKCYETLHDNEPQNTTVALNMCVALSKAKKYDEAINMLYRLDIECPDSMPVKRVLAWTLMGLGKYEQAEKEYNRLTADNDVENGDWLNAGYCQWLKGNTPEAINRFKNFMANRNIHSPKREHEISYEFANDKDFLYEHGINDTDIHLMADIIDGATE